MLTFADQQGLVAPTETGELGLFNTITADTLRHGDWSFSVYYSNANLTAAPGRDFAPPSARRYRDMGYDLNRLSASVGYGLSDRWEISAMLPWDRLVQNGGDRVGFINGWFYQGKFTDSGVGDVHLATKIAFSPSTAPTRFALSLFADLPTGNDKSGISTGSSLFGVGGHWTHGIGTLSASYAITGDRSGSRSNFPGSPGTTVQTPNVASIDGGLNVPLHMWSTTNWISELNTKFYQGGDRNPKAPINLVTGIRHWFGTSGWALNAGIRWNAAKFSYDHSDCRITELDNCGLAGLVGLTFAPMHLASIAPMARVRSAIVK